MGQLVLFDRFKRRSQFQQTKPQRPKGIFFQILFDEEWRAYLKILDQEYRAIAQPDYHLYEGPLRKALKALHRLAEAQSNTIDWSGDNRLYLADNDLLLSLMAECNNLINFEKQPLGFVPGSGIALLKVIRESDDGYRGGLFVDFEGSRLAHPIPITEHVVLIGTQFVEVQSLGDRFTDLALFSSQFTKPDLPAYLALALTHAPHLELLVDGFNLRKAGSVSARPAIIFEKIAPDGALFLRVGTSLPGLSPSFYADFEPSRYGNVNEEAGLISIHDVEPCDPTPAFTHVQRTLSKHQRASGGEFARDGALFIIDSDLAETFITAELADLVSRFAVVGAAKLKVFKVSTRRPKLNLKFDHGVDFLEGQVDLNFEGKTIALGDALKQYRNQGYVTLSDGTKGLVDSDYFKKLERIFAFERQKVRLSIFDVSALEALIDDHLEGAAFKPAQDFYKGFLTLETKKTRLPKIEGSPRPYQKFGYRWLRYLYDHGHGGCLADDMGLGKTLQTIMLFAAIYPNAKKPSLVVAPRTLLYNWEAECQRFAPKLQVTIYHGTQRNWKAAQKSQIILTTYAIMRSDIIQMRETELDTVVLDESQNIKNPQSQAARAVLLLKANHRFALSGTPVENHLNELYSLFRFLNPGMLGSQARFIKFFGNPIMKDGDDQAAADLRRKIKPYILRRLKSDVLTELPPKTERVLTVELSENHRSFYEKRRAFYAAAVNQRITKDGMRGAQFFVFQALSDLRQAASMPEEKSARPISNRKRESLLEQIEEATQNGHKVLVFANFLDALARIGEDLSKRNIDYALMTGATRDRNAQVQRFQDDQKVSVFLMTLKTGGLGLNLTAADHVFIYDPWWNVAAEQQAIDRCYRMGQEKHVFATRMIARGTIEEKIQELQERKTELIDSVIEADAGGTKLLTRQDVEFLLG
jgi:hypothetical protein